MVTDMVMSEEARERADLIVSDLRTYAVCYLNEHDGSAPLGNVLHALRKQCRADDLISRALSGALSSGYLTLTPDRQLRLVTDTARCAYCGERKPGMVPVVSGDIRYLLCRLCDYHMKRDS